MKINKKIQRFNDDPDRARVLTMYIAMVVRNSMEDYHADEGISDAQLKELNPIIRNAIYKALYAFFYQEKYPGAADFITGQVIRIPDYWEDPQLTEEFKALLEKRSENQE